MYASILQWTHEAHSQGYNFVPFHGNEESLIMSLQTQLHLEHFQLQKIEIKLPSNNVRVESTQYHQRSPFPSPSSWLDVQHR